MRCFVISLKSEKMIGKYEAERISNWDSVGHINLISSLEETFDINMEPEDMFEITSYSDGLLVLHNQYNIEF